MIKMFGLSADCATAGRVIDKISNIRLAFNGRLSWRKTVQIEIWHELYVKRIDEQAC